MSLNPPDPRALARQARRLAKLGETPWLSQILAARMAERLDWIKLDAHTLVLWQGLLGGGHAALRARYPQAEVLWAEPDAAEPAQRLLRTPWWQPWKRNADQVLAPDALPLGGAQMLWASLGLLGQADPDALFRRWAQALAPQGYLMFSTLGPDSFKELRALYASQGWGVATPAWIDLHDLGDALLKAGFADPVMDQERITLTWADAETLWRELAALGGNLAPDRHLGLRTPRWKQRWLAAAGEQLRQSDGRLALTLEFVCGHALKAEPRVPGEASVSLSSLKDQLAQRRRP